MINPSPSFIMMLIFGLSASLSANEDIFRDGEVRGEVNKQEGISESAKSLEGMSLDELVNFQPLTKTEESLDRKKIATDRFEETISNTNYPNIQEHREFLVRENLGAPVNPSYFAITASYLMSKAKEWKIGTGVNKELIEFWIIKSYSIYGRDSDRLKINSDHIYTRSPENTEELYRGGFIFTSSDKPKLKEELDLGDILRRRNETKNCLGEKNSTKGLKAVDRESVMNCFQMLDYDFFEQMGYKDNKPLGLYRSLEFVTVIVNEAGRHHCMASIYKNNAWVTAEHCLKSSAINSGIYILTGDSRIKIRKEDIRICIEKNCDIGLILAPTPSITDELIVSTENTREIHLRTDLLIPGIESGTPVFSNNKNNSRSMLMWSHVGKGYCNAYKVERGCVSHTCSTLTGFSGAPVYIEDAQKKIRLVGIHSGNTSDSVQCKTKHTNYATSSHFFEDSKYKSR